MPTAHRARFYTAVMRFLWDRPTVCTPRELAAWLDSSSFEDPPPDLAKMIQRLASWNPAAPFPALPDDDALVNGVRLSSARWWNPGAYSESREAAPLWLFPERS
jgi:hypothetical protein